MPKVRKLTPHEIEGFRKRHPSDHALEEEEAKVRREKAAFATLRRKSARRIGRCLVELGDPGEDLALQRLEESARRERGNAATHKRRLASLVGAKQPHKPKSKDLNIPLGFSTTAEALP